MRAAPPMPGSAPGPVLFEVSEIERSIVVRFEKIAAAYPDRAAVRQEGRVTTYSGLRASAAAAAASLAARLAGKDGPVVLLMDPGPPLFAVMLGALAAGRFYVPLDGRLPPARLASLCRELDAAALIADASSEALARGLAGAAPVWRADAITAETDGGAPLPEVSPDALACVLFTSGSTGKPKGVMQNHRNLLHNVFKLARGLAIRPDDRLTLLSSPAYGASISDVFGALLTGASVCPWDLAGEGLRRLPEFLQREGITIYHSVPSVFRSLAATLDGREHLSALRLIKLGGEAVRASDLDLYRNRFPRSCVFHVGLGATEMNVIRQWFAGHDTPWPGGAPLGYAVDGAEVVLLDEEGRRTENEGEIGVISRTLAVGYWKDPAGTAAAFRPVPGRPGERLYRTGDLGRMLPDGCLLHAGRRDAGVKVRGHRVDVSEVEAALRAVAGVREAVVEGRAGSGGTRLIAWLVPGAEKRPAVADLRRALGQTLPGHMIPSAFVFLDAMPRLPTGKIDRRALAEPERSRPALTTAFRAPSDPTEAAAALAFARVLDLDEVGADDDFFELGGDSLSAVELLVEASSRLGAELSAADLLEAPTPSGLAARARRGEAAPASGLVRLREGSGPPVFVVPGGAGDGEDLFAARRLARLAGEGFAFYGLRSGDPPFADAETLASRWLKEIRAVQATGPYRLVGDCVGGVLAFGIARRLREAGESVAMLALLDTPFPSAGRRIRAGLRDRAPGMERAWRRARYFARRLRYHAGVIVRMPRGRAAYALRTARVGAGSIAPVLSPREREAAERRAAYVATLMAWKPKPYDGTLRLIESAETARRGHGAAWSRRAARAERVGIPGGHADFILENGARVAEALSAWLAAAD